MVGKHGTNYDEMYIPNDKTKLAMVELELTGALAQLRHAYMQLDAGTVMKQKEFANGLLAPQIRRLEKLRDALISDHGQGDR